MRTARLSLLLPGLVVAAPLLAQAPIEVRPDGTPTVVQFALERAVPAVTVGGQNLTVRYEARPNGAFTGRYRVELAGAAVPTDSIPYPGGGPRVAFARSGQPSVVVVSVYTGGTGATAVPDCHLKLLVVGLDGVRAFTVRHDELNMPSDSVLSIERHAPAFVLTFWGGLKLSYDAGRLLATGVSLHPQSGAQAASRPPVSPGVMSAEEAVMRDALRGLVTAEEAYFADHVTYATLAQLGALAAPRGVIATVVLPDDARRRRTHCARAPSVASSSAGRIRRTRAYPRVPPAAGSSSTGQESRTGGVQPDASA